MVATLLQLSRLVSRPMDCNYVRTWCNSLVILVIILLLLLINLQFFQNISSFDLIVHMFGDSIISQGSLFQSLIIRWKKKCFLQFKWLKCL